jgi:hypothetical protein
MIVLGGAVSSERLASSSSERRLSEGTTVLVSAMTGPFLIERDPEGRDERAWR